jgi:hypothetical protein
MSAAQNKLLIPPSYHQQRPLSFGIDRKPESLRGRDYMEHKSFAADFMTEAAKGTPPVAVTAAAFAGWGVTEWVALITGFYVVLQGAYLIWKWRREAMKPNG